jgi:heat shock protein HslJ
MKKYLLFLLVASLVLSACTPKEKSLQGSWTITSYGPQGATTPVVEDSQASLSFNSDGTITGSSGCNGFGGEYKVDGDQVVFSGMASTLMACSDPLMTQEGSVFQVLNGTATYKIDGSKLTITNADLVLELTSAGAEAYPSYPK